MTLSPTDHVAWARLRDEIDAGIPVDTIAAGFGVTPADLMAWIFAYKESPDDKAAYKRQAHAEESRRRRAEKLQSFSAIRELDTPALTTLRETTASRITVEAERMRRVDEELERRIEIHGVYP